MYLYIPLYHNTIIIFENCLFENSFARTEPCDENRIDQKLLNR
jgi:hypothetical protein